MCVIVDSIGYFSGAQNLLSVWIDRVWMKNTFRSKLQMKKRKRKKNGQRRKEEWMEEECRQWEREIKQKITHETVFWFAWTDRTYSEWKRKLLKLNRPLVWIGDLKNNNNKLGNLTRRKITKLCGNAYVSWPLRYAIFHSFLLLLLNIIRLDMCVWTHTHSVCLCA